MRILIVGGGAREHALAWACRRDHPDSEITCAPGNGGTAAIATNVPVAVDDPDRIVALARGRRVELVILGPDAAAAAGVADALRFEEIPCFGPGAAAAHIESSKIFAKELMERAGIPTAVWRAGTAADRDSILGFARERDGRCVVKADGLALGKGVTVCDSLDDVQRVLDEIWVQQRFGAAGDRVVVEERLEGAEVSVFALTDGEHVRMLPGACDYKRAQDGDRGPNTGGMGVYTPPAQAGWEGVLFEAERRVIRPAVNALREMTTPFIGCLYAGLMLTPDGVRVLEFNARFGDPEAQVILPVLGEDVLELLTASATGELRDGRARVRADHAAVGVVAAAAGYPDTPRSGDAIHGLDSIPDDILVFHGGTRSGDAGTLTSGGRVLTVVAVDGDVGRARERAYAAIAKVNFEGIHYRHDIAAEEVRA